MVSFTTTDIQANLTMLLRRVAAGERIEISEGGQAIAMLVPAESPEKPDSQESPKPSVKQVIEAMIARRDSYGPRLGPDITLRELIEEGRR